MNFTRKLAVIDVYVLREFVKLSRYAELKWGWSKDSGRTISLFFTVLFIVLGHGSWAAYLYNKEYLFFSTVLTVLACGGLIGLVLLVYTVTIKKRLLASLRTEDQDIQKMQRMRFTMTVLAVFLLILYFESDALFYLWYSFGLFSMTAHLYFKSVLAGVNTSS